jgi:UDP-N-acetyl-D-galactosamine dehydrogenase
MGKYVAEQTVKHLLMAGKKVKGARVMVMGITFKENVSDIRNSRVIELIQELREYKMDVLVCDPHADALEVRREYGLRLSSYQRNAKLDALVIAVNHAEFKKMLNVRSLARHLSHGHSRGVVIDVKGILDPKELGPAKILYWRL